MTQAGPLYRMLKVCSSGFFGTAIFSIECIYYLLAEFQSIDNIIGIVAMTYLQEMAYRSCKSLASFMEWASSCKECLNDQPNVNERTLIMLTG